MRCALVGFRPRYLTVMSVRVEERLKALGRVVFGGKGRSGPLCILRGSIQEERVLKRMPVCFCSSQSSPIWYRLPEDRLRCAESNCTFASGSIAHLLWSHR